MKKICLLVIASIMAVCFTACGKDTAEEQSRENLYGKQESGGYSVTVNDLYETENAIYVNTNLLGPKAGSTPATSPSYPYIVLKVEFREKTVVFD